MPNDRPFREIDQATATFVIWLLTVIFLSWAAIELVH